MTNSKISKYISIGIRIAALLLIILFFVPSICVSCDDMEVSFSAFEAAMGQVEEDLALEYDYVLFVVLLLPLLILICANKAPIITATLSVMNIVAMIIYIIMVKIRCDAYFEGIEMMVNVKPKFAFVLNIVLCLAIMGAVIFERLIIARFAVPEENSAPEKFCPMCGCPAKHEDQFCMSCGAKIATESENMQ